MLRLHPDCQQLHPDCQQQARLLRKGIVLQCLGARRFGHVASKRFGKASCCSAWGHVGEAVAERGWIRGPESLGRRLRPDPACEVTCTRVQRIRKHSESSR